MIEATYLVALSFICLLILLLPRALFKSLDSLASSWGLKDVLNSIAILFLFPAIHTPPYSLIPFLDIKKGIAYLAIPQCLFLKI